MRAAREQTVEQDLSRGQLIWREWTCVGLPLGDATQALAYQKLPMSRFGQPGAEGHPVLAGSGFRSRRDFSIDGNGSLHHSHTLTVAPPVVLQAQNDDTDEAACTPEVEPSRRYACARPRRVVAGRVQIGAVMGSTRVPVASTSESHRLGGMP